MVRRIYRSYVQVRRTTDQVLAGLGCGHLHRSEDAARKCLATRLHDIARHPLPPIEMTAAIQYTHSRHDWFPL